MSDSQAPAQQQPPQAPEGSPVINVIAQFTKDLSFESPNAPACFAPSPDGKPFFEGQPDTQVRFNITHRDRGDGFYDFEMVSEGTHKVGDKTVFAYEITYASIVQLVNIAPEWVVWNLMVECARLIFPYVRQTFDEAVTGGGFPSFRLNPPDWVLLYNQNTVPAPQPGAAAVA